MSSADRAFRPYRWATHAIIVSNTPLRFQRSIMSAEAAIHLRMLLVSTLTTFSVPPTNFGCIDSFLLPNSRNEEMMGDGFLWCWLLPVCFEQ